MSSAKRALQRVIRSWLEGTGPAPHVLRHCETCGDKSWRELATTVRAIQIDAHLPNGLRADAVLTDAKGNLELVIQFDGRSRLPNRVSSSAGLPMIVLRGESIAADPARWWAVREHGLPAWRCRCAGTRALSVDDDFSLRVIGCPINLRTDGVQHYARVIEDCGRCAFFVGIGYLGTDRRRIQLRCGFGAPPSERRGPLQAPPLTQISRREIVAGT